LKHFASPDFWRLLSKLPVDIQRLARSNFELLKSNPHHPSLHFKKVGRYWSDRIGLAYGTLGQETEEGILWGWIGSHAEYDRVISS
jgi:hypothetical protein